MNKKLLPLLVCPLCKGKLQYLRKHAVLVCEKDRRAFPVRDGIPILLEMDARDFDARAWPPRA